MDDPRPTDSAILAGVRPLWPQVDWSMAEFLHGAFHRVIRIGAANVVRVVLGTSHEQRAASELQNLVTFDAFELPFALPAPLSGNRTFRLGSAYLTSFVGGKARSEPDWETVRGPIATILLSLHSAVLSEGTTLRPIREWCGGEAWPGLVGTIVHHWDTRFRLLAESAVARVLQVEQAVAHVMVHGDLGPHNILFSDDGSFGLIDFDNAGLGDPAIDIAPLIGVYGSAAVSDIADVETVQRAKVHRASLALQVAAAEQLIADGALRDHALRNFLLRAETGTLYEPDLHAR